MNKSDIADTVPIEVVTLRELRLDYRAALNIIFEIGITFPYADFNEDKHKKSMKLNQEWPQRLSLRLRRIEGRSVHLSCTTEL